MPPASEGAGPSRPQSGAYQLFMLVLCLLVLGVLAVDATAELDAETALLLRRFDLVVAFIFMGDFLASLYRAENRRRYLLTWGWIDLLSSLPSVAFLRWGRAARVVRILRVLRGLRSIRILGAMVLENRRRSTFLAAIFVLLLALFGGAVAVLEFEVPAGGNIRTAGDALWWALVTMSTAGFGDLYPVTPEGRVVASALMVTGIGIFGAVTGLFASLLVGGEEPGRERELLELRARVAELEQGVRGAKDE